jgi:hypothetical protein
MRALSQGLRLRLQTEETVEKHLRKRIKLMRGLCIKIRLLPGWPDRLVFLHGGILVFFELKRPKGGKFEPRQLRVHKMLRGFGFAVYVANTKEMIDEILDTHYAEP